MAIVGAPAGERPAASALHAAAGVLASPRRTLCAAVVVLTAVVGLDALSDPDVWWHMVVGSWILQHGTVPHTELLSYTAGGSPFATHEWLAGVLFAAVSAAGGLFLLALVMGAVSWGAFIAIALHGRVRGAGPVTIALWLALAARAAEPVLGIRPQVFTFAGIAIAMGLVERHLRRGGRLLWVLPPVFLVWANLHPGDLAGIGLMVLVCAVELSKAALHRGTPVPAARTRGLVLVTLACAAATFLTPQGAGVYGFVLQQTGGEAAKGIIEWQRPNFADPATWPLLGLLAGFTGLALARLRARELAVRDAVVGAVACGAALLALRNTSLGIAVVTPMCMGWSATMLRARAARRQAGSSVAVSAAPQRVTPAAVLAGALLLVAACTALGIAVVRVQASASPAGVASSYPACAAGVLQRAPAGQHIFTSYGAGGYVAYRLWPRDLVYIYGASDPFSMAVFADYYRIASNAASAPTALQLLDSSDTTAVLFPTGPLTAELARTPGWTHVVSDHGMQLFVRGDAAWAAGAACQP